MIRLLIAAALISLNAWSALTLNGAGATFPFPFYAKVFDEYHKSNSEVQVNYNSIGSGGGIKALLDNTVHFGASDAPMNAEELKKAPGAIFHIPTVIGAVVVSYNLPDFKGDINLSADVLSDILLGKIKKWNDPKIAALNKGAKIPDLDIVVCYRSDGSGTTAVFTEYLSSTNAEWKEKVGAGKSVSWPVGLAGKGNEGVAGLLKQNPGAIGYVELVYALSNGLGAAKLKNKAGKFVEASVKSVRAAASSAKAPKDFRVSADNAAEFKSNMSILDGAAKDAYPISSFTYLLVPEKLPKETGKDLQKAVAWLLDSKAQGFAENLHFVPLPNKLAAAAKGNFLSHSSVIK